MNVSRLKRPMKSPTALPLALLSMSPWYHAMPNGAFGTCVTNRSNSAFGGRPLASTCMTSTGPSELTVTFALAFSAHPAVVTAAERTILKTMLCPAAAAVPGNASMQPSVPSVPIAAETYLLMGLSW
jgi:hypothetical protein